MNLNTKSCVGSDLIDYFVLNTCCFCKEKIVIFASSFKIDFHLLKAFKDEVIRIFSYQKFWLKNFQLTWPKCNKHWKDFFFSPQEFNSFGECLSWLRVQRFQTLLKSDWWMDDWQQKESAHSHAEWNIFLYLTYLCHENFAVAILTLYI